MSAIGQPERATQNRVIALFRDELGYRYLDDWAERVGNSNIEEALLADWLHKRGYLLSAVERDLVPSLALRHSRMILTVRAGTDAAAKEAIVAQWYREQIRAAASDLIAKWEPLLGVSVSRVFVQQMKTKWGSCNPRARSIRLNTELAKKPRECIEYIVVHELVHLIEPTHNARFVALMDQFMPKWQFCRQRLNRLPVRHADWDY